MIPALRNSRRNDPEDPAERASVPAALSVAEELRARGPALRKEV